MKEPEHIKEIHRIREKMAERCGFDAAKFAKMIRRAEARKRKSASPAR